MSDELRSWAMRSAGRATPAEPAAAARPIPAPVLIDHSDGYRPWSPALPQQTMLEVWQRAFQGETGIGRMMPLHYLLNVAFTFSPLGDHLTLSFADCIITIRGRHLEELRRDLANGKVGAIREHEPNRWPMPASGEPVILSIEVIAPGATAGRA